LLSNRSSIRRSNIGSKNRRPLPLLLVFGPTAVGKSDFVYSTFGSICEIINSDSQQVYKYIDIGTAKPDKEILRKIPHHLIDIIDPKQQFHSGEFVRQALDIAHEVYSRKKVPIIVGGTAFYLKNLIFGLSEAPPSDKLIRTKLLSECKSAGLCALYERLEKIDPLYASKIGPSDKQRILRALEVYEASGIPLSSFDAKSGQVDDFTFFLAGLNIEREKLYEKINRRVDMMFEEGLISELKRLLSSGYTFEDPGMKGIGYSEFLVFQKGCMTIGMLKELIKRDSRRFAKRQMTFFRSFAGVRWFHPDDNESFKSQAFQFLTENLPSDFDLYNLFSVH
jgi:tRNA dimethylallyltransferase